MPTIAENLQTLVDQKAAIKEALQKQRVDPTESLGTYAGLIDSLENPERIQYFVTNDDAQHEAYANLLGREKVTLTAGPNDIREGTVAIIDSGVIHGEKDIPGYYVKYGWKLVPANDEVTISLIETNYKQILVSIATYNSSVSDSISVQKVSVENAMYDVNSTDKLSDITIENNVINLGILVNEMSILRYFIVREEV